MSANRYRPIHWLLMLALLFAPLSGIGAGVAVESGCPHHAESAAVPAAHAHHAQKNDDTAAMQHSCCEQPAPMTSCNCGVDGCAGCVVAGHVFASLPAGLADNASGSTGERVAEPELRTPTVYPNVLLEPPTAG